MLTIRHIQTTTDAEGTIRPTLDADGREIELWSVDVPRSVEAEGGEAIDAYVADHLAKPVATAPEELPA